MRQNSTVCVTGENDRYWRKGSGKGLLSAARTSVQGDLVN